MKSLYLIRHAKSSWATASLSDFERPLKSRGLSDATLMGKILFKKSLTIDLIRSSPANRAISTARLIAQEIKYPLDEIQTVKKMYHATMDDLLSIIYFENDEYDNVALFGHNPTFTDLSNYFTNAQIMNVPTTGIVAITFDTQNWGEVSPQNASLKFFEYPKLYHS